MADGLNATFKRHKVPYIQSGTNWKGKASVHQRKDGCLGLHTSWYCVTCFNLALGCFSRILQNSTFV